MPREFLAAGGWAPEVAARTASTIVAPATASGSLLRSARARTSAPSSAPLIAIANRRAVAGSTPSCTNQAVPPSIQLPKTSTAAHERATMRE